MVYGKRLYRFDYVVYNHNINIPPKIRITTIITEKYQHQHQKQLSNTHSYRRPYNNISWRLRFEYRKREKKNCVLLYQIAFVYIQGDSMLTFRCLTFQKIIKFSVDDKTALGFLRLQKNILYLYWLVARKQKFLAIQLVSPYISKYKCVKLIEKQKRNFFLIELNVWKHTKQQKKLNKKHPTHQRKIVDINIWFKCMHKYKRRSRKLKHKYNNKQNSTWTRKKHTKFVRNIKKTYAEQRNCRML